MGVVVLGVVLPSLTIVSQLLRKLFI
jgi:hypothetical protein